MKIIFRTDGNTNTGLGHIMRSAAVMQILQPRFGCEFWTKNPSFVPTVDFKEAPVIVHFQYENLLEEANALCQSLLPDQTILVLDGYQFNTEYQRILKNSGIKFVCIDDVIQYHFLADLVINHAGGISELDYSCEPYTKLLLGPEYALVNPLFYEELRPMRDFSNGKIFVSLGAADPNNDTDRVLNILTSIGLFNEIHIVIGAANQNLKELKAKYVQNQLCRFHSNLSGNSVYKLMEVCTHAVLTPSTICYEYMSVGGAVYLYKIAENQQRIKEYFIGLKMAFPFEEIENVTLADKKYALEQQVRIFDHKSPERLLKAFVDLSKKPVQVIM